MSALLLGAALWPSTPAPASSCAGVSLPERVRVAGAEFVLNGIGVRKATLLQIEVYVAGLYLTHQVAEAEQILNGDLDWHLAMAFVRDVDAAKMRDAFTRGLAANSGDALEKLQPDIDQFTAAIVDVVEGQTVSFTHAQDSGVVIAVDGDARGRIDNPHFAEALLSIWLGPKPSDKALKTGLLGGPCA
ncbi:MAG: chalcone isomerase family protein [Geminicoccaceae bacterium]